MKIRIPYDEEYVKSLGITVYVFASYEWNIVYIIERLQPGFLLEYCRKKTMTSGKLYKKFENVLEQEDTGHHDVNPIEMKNLCTEFKILVEKRNALIHAHPITDADGAQVLNYQGKLSRAISDMKWKIEDIEKLAEKIGTYIPKLP